MFWKLSSGKRNDPKKKKNKVKVGRENCWIKQNKRNDKTDLMSYRLAFCYSAQNTMCHCHGNVALLHLAPKTQTKPMCTSLPLWTPPHTHRGSLLFTLTNSIFLSLSIEFNLLWFFSRHNRQSYIVSAIISKELSGQNCFLTEDKTQSSRQNRCNTSKRTWILFAFPVSLSPLLDSSEKLISITEQQPHHSIFCCSSVVSALNPNQIHTQELLFRCTLWGAVEPTCCALLTSMSSTSRFSSGL